ncbi:DUF423 domain-containing protein [Devosia psychrophila]|uniref:Uncharacterized membrane protein YgdD, TMEM256/DUF423 family n=1 Tax=Devosia psychrophila TaxID=728005 RepID=A0A0F5PQJ4_9HYPH|nr:DUF423 domain-containing protein [Devosia psychrophila]KKC30957.1 hypothetical protein WH91_22260 [Devosia psychrophila]SFC86538.1 Uncharacterized membrane protein YgdD, TMEM256/DUF423 family [Devosia psychrophila]
MAGDRDTMRLVLAAAGLIGAAGVASAAAASHAGESRNLAAIAAICLSHGPALLALGLFGQGRLLGLASVLIAAGTMIFAGDLGMREWVGHGLFPGAAPIGGVGMIGGWLVIVVAGALWRRA